MIDYIPLPDEPIGEIGGVDAWSATHPERQLTFGECETIVERETTEEEKLLRRRGFLR